jgi:hypothetical protein
MVLWHRASLGVMRFSLLARPSRFGISAEEQRGMSGRISTLPAEAGGSRQGEHDTNYSASLVKQSSLPQSRMNRKQPSLVGSCSNSVTEIVKPRDENCQGP